MSEEEITEAVEAPEVVDTPEAPEAPEKNWSDDDEAEARLFGWKSPKEWQGDKPEGYIDNPEEFLGRVQRSRIFQAMNGKLEKATSSYEEHARKLEAMSAKALEIQKSQYEARMADVVSRQRAAFANGDEKAYDAAEAERAELLKKAPQEEQPKKEAPRENPDVAAYRANNKWTQNPILWREAVEAVNYMPNLATATVTEQLQYAEKMIREARPELFKKPEPPRQKVEGGGLAPSAKKSAFDGLPSEARDQFRKFVEQKIYKDTKEDREEYANEYANS